MKLHYIATKIAVEGCLNMYMTVLPVPANPIVLVHVLASSEVDNLVKLAKHKLV